MYTFEAERTDDIIPLFLLWAIFQKLKATVSYLKQKKNNY